MRTLRAVVPAPAWTPGDAGGGRRRVRGHEGILRTVCTVACVACLAIANAALAHEVLHSIERDRAVVVKAFWPDGKVLADARYEVYSPTNPDIPHQTGRTDRRGYLAFVPDATGQWRVKLVDDSGHGFDTAIEVPSLGAVAGRGADSGGAVGSAAFVLRPLLGLAAIAAVFAGLFVFLRRRGIVPRT
jgi:nickel transport protein